MGQSESFRSKACFRHSFSIKSVYYRNIETVELIDFFLYEIHFLNNSGTISKIKSKIEIFNDSKYFLNRIQK